MPDAPLALDSRRPASTPETDGAAQRPRVRLSAGRTFARGRTIARVIIPRIDVRARMSKLGLNRDNSLQVPGDPEKTGWWAGGAKPGKRGAAVIVGHVDSQSGPAVFHRLRELSKGDRVKVVHNDGSRATFEVTGRGRVPKNSFPIDEVYDATRRATLRLITCTGEFSEARGHYRDNLIVFGRAI